MTVHDGDCTPLPDHAAPAGRPADAAGLTRSRHDRLQRARALIDDARVAERRGALDHALCRYGEALDLLSGTAQVDVLADVLRWKGTVHRERGETAEAWKLYRQSADVAAACAYDAGTAHAVNCLATVAQRRGDLVEAERLYHEAALLAITAGEQRLLGMVQQNLGILANVRGDLDAALVRYRMSLRLFAESGDEEAMSWVLNNLGMLAVDQGQFAEADAAFDRALALAQAREDTRVTGALELSRVERLVAGARWEAAEDGCAHALRAAEVRGDRLRRGEALKFQGMIDRQRGEYDRAAAALLEARELAAAGQDALLTAELLYELGETWRLRGDPEEARQVWEAAAALFGGLGATSEVGETQIRLAGLFS